MSKPLLELQAEYQLILHTILESPDEHDQAELIVKENEIATKVDSYKYILDKLKADQAFFAEKAKEYQQAKKTLANAEASMKDRLKQFLERTDTHEVKGESVRFKLSPAKMALRIADEAVVPSKYKKEVVTLEIDKDRLKADLERGEAIKGCSLEGGWSLRSYVTKAK